MCAASAPSFAASSATLSAVTIQGTQDTFEITLKTTKDTEVSTKVPSKNKLILDLDNTNAAELIKTSFSGAKKIDDVIVQSTGKNKTRLYISGNNVSKSKIIIDSTKEPVVVDRYAQDNSYSLINKPSVESLEKQIASNETVSAKDFIENYSNETNTEAEPAETTAEPTEESLETTGVISAPSPEKHTTGENDTIETSNEATSTETDFFKPAAVLELPEENTATTTIKNKSQESAAVATAQNFKKSGNKAPFIPQEWLLRFGLIFIFVTVLVAFLRKENIISLTFNRKSKHQVLNREHLDIYRSLHDSTGLSAPYNRTTGRSKISTLDSVTSRKSRNYAAQKKQPAKPSKKLNQFNAMQGYNTQNTRRANNARSLNTSKQALNTQNAITQNRRNSTTKRQHTTDSVNFLKSMAEMYKQSGRHDLAISIQNKLRQVEAQS